MAFHTHVVKQIRVKSFFGALNWEETVCVLWAIDEHRQGQHVIALHSILTWIQKLVGGLKLF